ncbi:MAG: alpha amylase N-terminal ig-like domain-containing protein [bacterium]
MRYSHYIIPFIILSIITSVSYAIPPNTTPDPGKEQIVFKFQPVIGAERVCVAGSFNNWTVDANPMQDENKDGIWETTLYLAPGEYQYKFVINGNVWQRDLNNKLTFPDNYGDFNSVLRVGKWIAPEKNKPNDGKIDIQSIFHSQESNFLDRLSSDSVLIRLRTNKNDVSKVVLQCISQNNQESIASPLVSNIPLKLEMSSNDHDYFATIIKLSNGEFDYLFQVCDGKKAVWYSAGGISEQKPEPNKWFKTDLAQLFVFTTPDWAKNAVCYQIFPERFYNGDTANDPEKVQPWGGKPEWFNFFGGDLDGIRQKLDYLQDLGITAIYLNPIFESLSNHKYDAIDYLKIDSHFGTLTTFHSLVSECHQRGINLILDGVFNHTADEFWAFQDIVKHGKESKYWNWYFIHGYPIATSPQPNYDAWWGFGDMPKLNNANPEVRQHLLYVSRYWLEQGANGWRMDVPNEIPHEFWKLFRKETKSVDPNAYLVSEIWDNAYSWLSGDEFDATMNYRFRNTLLAFFAQDALDVDSFLGQLGQIRADYPLQAYQCLFNLMGSHDVPRVLTLCNENTAKQKLIALFQLTYPGTPVIYYGDEIGMTGQRDPDNRRCMVWEPEKQNQDLFNWYKQLIKLRKQYSALRTGEFKPVKGEVIPLEGKKDNNLNDQILVYQRRDTLNAFMVVINNSTQPAKLVITGVHNAVYRDVLSNKKYQPISGKLTISTIAPKSGLILHRE